MRILEILTKETVTQGKIRSLKLSNKQNQQSSKQTKPYKGMYFNE